LLTNPYVIVVTLDFSKAFDTVRHSTPLNKIAQLNVPDHVYNGLVDFFAGHMHQTKHGDQMSSLRPISASIIQGSATEVCAGMGTAGIPWNPQVSCMYGYECCKNTVGMDLTIAGFPRDGYFYGGNSPGMLGKFGCENF